MGATELPDRHLPADTLVYLSAAAGDDGREWLGMVVSHREDDVVVRIANGNDGDALPGELWAVAVFRVAPVILPAPGVSVGVVWHDRAVLVEGFGVREEGMPAKVTPGQSP